MIYATICPASEVEQGEIYKYIRLSTNEIRLARLYGLGPDHISLVDDEKNETVVSAGTIRIGWDNVWDYAVGGYGSSTCKVGWLPDDTELLTAVLGFPIRK